MNFTPPPSPPQSPSPPLHRSGSHADHVHCDLFQLHSPAGAPQVERAHAPPLKVSAAEAGNDEITSLWLRKDVPILKRVEALKAAQTLQAIENKYSSSENFVDAYFKAHAAIANGRNRELRLSDFPTESDNEDEEDTLSWDFVNFDRDNEEAMRIYGNPDDEDLDGEDVELTEEQERAFPLYNIGHMPISRRDFQDLWEEAKLQDEEMRMLDGEHPVAQYCNHNEVKTDGRNTVCWECRSEDNAILGSEQVGVLSMKAFESLKDKVLQHESAHTVDDLTLYSNAEYIRSCNFDMLTDEEEEAPELQPATAPSPAVRIGDTFYDPQSPEPFDPDVPTQARMVTAFLANKRDATIFNGTDPKKRVYNWFRKHLNPSKKVKWCLCHVRRHRAGEQWWKDYFEHKLRGGREFEKLIEDAPVTGKAGVKVIGRKKSGRW